MIQKCWDWFLMGLCFGLGWALVGWIVGLLQTALAHAR